MGAGFSFSGSGPPDVYRPRYQARYRPPAAHHGRRRRLWPVSLVVLVAAVVVVGLLAAKREGLILAAPKASTTTLAMPLLAAQPTAPPRVRSSLLHWRLPVPISQAVVLPGRGAHLVIAGGIPPSGKPANGAFILATSNGSLRPCADLLTGVHEASGAILEDRDFVFGGMGPGPTASVQSFAEPSSATTAASTPTADATTSLPRPRAGSAAVTVGNTVYLVGGYGGGTANGDVLATKDGRTFTTVATLPVAVRDPAVAALGRIIYVFGGATTSSAASAVTDIQQVDPGRQAAVVGQLPEPVEGAVAVTLDGQIYVAGGQGPSGTNAVIWGFEQASSRVAPSGRLHEAVSGAGVAVRGSTAWLVGGESGAHLVGSVQTFSPVASPARSQGPGSSRPPATTSTSPPRRG